MWRMNRHLVLFAREPARQAREKGLETPEAAELFRSFAAGWLEAAGRVKARLIVATPPEDLTRWHRALAGIEGLGWICQRGNTMGERLEDVARRASAFGGHAVLVGGDVSPSESILENAFEALETGADAAVSPALDGGVSLLALSGPDLDLLRGIRPRSRTVLPDLLGALRHRGRRVELVGPAADVDGPRSLRALLRMVRDICRQKPMQAFMTREIAPGDGAVSDADLDAHIAANSITVHHPLGTCKMGLASDPLAVVDAELRVFGTEGLRVVDGAVLPDLVGAHINAPIIMIAEKAADLIRGRAALEPARLVGARELSRQ